MLLNHTPLWIQKESINLQVQNPICTKKGTYLFHYHLHKIPTYSSKLTPKSPNVVQIFAENINDLPSSLPHIKVSKKYHKLNHLFLKLDVEIVSLIEIQINPELLDHNINIADKIIAMDLSVSSLDNNINELIGARQ